MPERERLRSSLDGSSAHGRAVLGCTTVLVKATPIGTRDLLAIPLADDLREQLPSDVFVCDMIYNWRLRWPDGTGAGGAGTWLAGEWRAGDAAVPGR